MREIMIDDEDRHLLDEYKWFVAKVNERADGAPCLYYMSRSSGKTLYLHRLIMGVTEKGVYVDHRNGDGLNNHRSNLRIATNAQNQWNVAQPGDIQWVERRQRWRWRLRINGGRRIEGSGETYSEAVHRMNEAIIEHRGEFARLRSPRRVIRR